MTEQKRKHREFYLFHTAMLFTMILIFCFSSQNGEESSEISNAFLLWLLDRIGALISAGFQYWLTRWIRKMAHFTVYFLLGFCCTGTFAAADSLEKRKIYGKAVRGWVTCIVYAATDEVHQIFVPGRAGRIMDVMIDSSGALTGVLLCTGMFFLIKGIRLRYRFRKGTEKQE